MNEICDKCGFAVHGPGHSCPNQLEINKAQGLRYNEGKARIDLIPPEVIIELGKHYTYGANKYAPNNWRKGFPYSETFASLTRHLYAWWAGEDLDQESGHHHLIAVIWNAVTLMYFEMFPAKFGKFDDRIDNGGVPSMQTPVAVSGSYTLSINDEVISKHWVPGPEIKKNLLIAMNSITKPYVFSAQQAEEVIQGFYHIIQEKLESERNK